MSRKKREVANRDIRHISLLMALLALSVAATACERKEGPAERMGRAVDESIENLGDAADEAAGRLDGKEETTAEKMEDAANDLADEMEDAVEEVQGN